MRKKLKLFNRVLAFIYDVIIQIIIAVGIYLLAEHVIRTYVLNKGLYAILVVAIFLIALIIYFGIVPLKLKGTVGKYMADLEVVATKGTFTFGRWLFREVVFKYGYIYLGIIIHLWIDTIAMTYLYIYIGIGFLIQFVFILLKRSTIHDYYLKTKVNIKEIDD